VSVSTQENLQELFDELSVLRSKVLLSPDLQAVDNFAASSLKIVRLLLNNHALFAMLARHLSIIIDVKALPDEEMELLGSLKSIEQGLESQLRGFSSMFAWVLEDMSVRQDPEAALLQVSNLDPVLADHFLLMSRTLLAYLDLEEIFSTDCDISAVNLFLLGLQGVMGELFGDVYLAESLINLWLTERVKNKNIKSLFEASFESPHHLADFSKERIMVALSMKVAHGGIVKSSERAMLDQALRSNGMLGVAPLVEGGFLVLDEPPANSAVIRLVK
jgi:hypothetical protein